MVARSPPGSTARNSGNRNEPMNAIPKIITGKRAKLRLPKIVEWIRHSSFSMFVKSLNMAVLLHKREEKIIEMLVSLF